MSPTTAPRPSARSAAAPRRRAASVRLQIALTLARLAGWASRHLLRRGGNVIGGRVLMTLAPGAARALSAGRRIVLVTGTNGKSTTTALLAAALRTDTPVASNTDGANTPTGLLGALARDRTERCVLECDEAWLPWAVENLRPEGVVLLDLTRDQLHRNPEVRQVASRWREPLRHVRWVVANGDDPGVVWAAALAPRTHWVAGGQPWRHDSAVCPGCGDLLARSGDDWRCRCGLARPTPSAAVEVGELRLPGDVNQHNAELALAAAVACGADPDRARSAMRRVTAVSGRFAEVSVAGRRVRLLLAKNPASWQEALRTVAHDDRPVVIAFNADGVDGRDPSWLYDVDFTVLRGRPLTLTGRRATDLVVRLRMDEVSPLGQYADVAGAVRRLPDGPVDLIATYTAFESTRRRYA